MIAAIGGGTVSSAAVRDAAPSSPVRRGDGVPHHGHRSGDGPTWRDVRLRCRQVQIGQGPYGGHGQLIVATAAARAALLGAHAGAMHLALAASQAHAGNARLELIVSRSRSRRGGAARGHAGTRVPARLDAVGAAAPRGRGDQLQPRAGHARRRRAVRRVAPRAPSIETNRRAIDTTRVDADASSRPAHRCCSSRPRSTASKSRCLAAHQLGAAERIGPSGRSRAPAARAPADRCAAFLAIAGRRWRDRCAIIWLARSMAMLARAVAERPHRDGAGAAPRVARRSRG
jgi:hypothetical protein